MTEQQQALISISQRLEDENVPAKHSFEEQFNALVHFIEGLINTDFNKLISILYRVDVSEEKLKRALHQNPEIPASRIIATMLLERELEKRKWRAMYPTRK